MKLRVLYGGTFDPVHTGHIEVAKHARDVLDAEISLVPAGDPPHKGPTQASAAQRIAMCDLAIDGIPRLRVDPREALSDEPSYTIHTLESLRAETGPDAPVALLIGADSFLSLPTWKRWQDLFELAHFVVAQRPGNHLAVSDWPDALAQRAQHRVVTDADALHASAAGKIFLMRQPEFPQSSSELRRRIHDGEVWQPWVDPKVARFIVQSGLYL